MQDNERTVVVKDAAALASASTRRSFLRALGMGGTIVLLPSVFAACDESGNFVSPEVQRRFGGGATAGSAGSAVTLDLTTDIGIFNYAFALEQLEAAFYTQVVAASGFATTFPAANERRILTDLRDHEIVHREFFAAALGSAKIPNLTPNFSAVNFADRTSVLQTARTFEDLGVGAYNGAGRYLKTAAFLTLAGKIVSVEARHASTIRDVITPRSGGANGFAPNAYDMGITPQNVLAAAAPFIVENITVINA